MPWSDDPDMHALRMAYNIAVTTHSECSRALTEAQIRGDAATAALIEAEAKARHQKEMTRRQLHAAMLRAQLDPPPEPPPNDAAQ